MSHPTTTPPINPTATDPSATPTQVFLMLGSNCEPRQDFLMAACQLVAAEVGPLRWQSQVHSTPPYGVCDQLDFLNQLLLVETILLPRQLLCKVKELEQQLGRQSTYRWGPREIDIDIIFYGHWQVQTSELTIPHADYHNRIFVLDLLLEYDPAMCDPVSGTSVAALRQQLESASEL